MLPAPAEGKDLKDALNARFRVAKLGKAENPGSAAIAALLMTLSARAVLGPLNVTAHFSGPSGTCKTSVAQIAQGSFGTVPPRGFERTTTTWKSTRNGLQRLAYDCKDSLLIIDELTGEDSVKKATEIVQDQGNLTARGRMTKDLKAAPCLDPRGTVLSTGETNPARNSALGRMLIFPFARDTIDKDVLTKCQGDVAAGLHAAATAAYVRYLATEGRLARELAALPDRVNTIATEIRQEIQGGHPRAPWAIAQLLAGYEVWLRFARETGYLTEVEEAAYFTSAWDGLLTLVDGQRETHEETTPAARFLDLLRAALQSRRYHLADIKEAEPLSYQAACGWEATHLGSIPSNGRWRRWPQALYNQALAPLLRAEG